MFLPLVIASTLFVTGQGSSNVKGQTKWQQYQFETVLDGKKFGNVWPVPIDVRENMDPHLIDFVVAGFGKCGTTYLQREILYPSKRVFIPNREIHSLKNDNYKEFTAVFENVTRLSQNKNNQAMRFGYKAPFELGHTRSLRNLETLFPDVRFIITLRHPVLRFESMYNFKLRQLPIDKILPVEEHIGQCGEGCYSSTLRSPRKSEDATVTWNFLQRCVRTFCTGRSNYHHYLSRLGLTPMNTSQELDLLDHHEMSIHRGWHSGFGSAPDSRRLFLLEIQQWDDDHLNPKMADELVRDLESFLGLDAGDLPQAPFGRKKHNTYSAGRQQHVLDICLDKHQTVREILLKSARKASKWINEYLLHPSNSNKVMVSNIDTFKRMLNDWNTDPCSKQIIV